MKRNIFLLSVLFLISCGNAKEIVEEEKSKQQTWPILNDNTFDLKAVSKDKTYGYTEKNPIMVGGLPDSEGPLNERRFLNALAGPNGEYVTYERTGSCCQFKTDNSFMGAGLLDMYEITWKNQKESVTLYLNMYDAGELKAPMGFTIAKK